MTKTIAFHSYKGGTGKSTIAANLAATLAARGARVALLDLDVYAPSQHVYFEHNPTKWINDFLSASANVSEVMADMTPLLEGIVTDPERNMGRLWIGFSSPKKEDIYKLEGSLGSKEKDTSIKLLRKFIKLHDDICTKYDCDYVIIDTSPGVRFWSINSLAVANMILLTLKFGDLDIEGTKLMVADVHDAFKKHGANAYLLLNRVAGYCVPHVGPIGDKNLNEVGTGAKVVSDASQVGDDLSKELQIGLIASVPCYCDIQFSRKEFLTTLQHIHHPFAKQMESLARLIADEE